MKNENYSSFLKTIKQQCHAHISEEQEVSFQLSLSPWKGYGL